MIGEPLALDYDDNMVIDLFGLRTERDERNEHKRTFWIFTKGERNKFKVIDLYDFSSPPMNVSHSKITIPHSHSFLDLNGDSLADLCLSTKDGYEVWIANGDNEHFKYEYDQELSISYPTGDVRIYGQSVFLDFELNGSLTQIIPVCNDTECKNSIIWMRSHEHYNDLQVSFFQENNKTHWGFLTPNKNGAFYDRAITVRVGDFNNDGFPDLLATLEKKGSKEQAVQTFLLENVKNEDAQTSKKFKRTFVVRWNALLPFEENTVMGSFYDFLQDGILDVILLQKNDNKIKPVAFRNTLDYDANFVKVIVLTGLENKDKPPKEIISFGSTKQTYGSNIPGPKIKYHTTTQEGLPQHGVSAQLSQSAYFSLHLPYTIFGLGRTPNFVDYVEIHYAGKNRSWQQIIPNSQMLVIPKNPLETYTWKLQLFVTPSKVIIQSVIALLGICLVILIIILILHIKERREDKLEKLQEAQRFHFDAM
jgi:integrin alpha FG-GAP repeat containing protein 1